MLSDTASLSNKTTELPRLVGALPHARFEAWADYSPESVAISGEHGTVTYAEVERRSNQIAHALSSAGVKRGNIVGIFLERGSDLVCAVLGVLKSGAAFTILDPRVPQAALAR